MSVRETAGEKAFRALHDSTSYDPLEIGETLCGDLLEQLHICIQNHEAIFDEPEFFLVRVIAGDPLIKNLKRHKYYAWLFLPAPRPSQAVFHYTKATGAIKFLWALPPAETMAYLSTSVVVPDAWKRCKAWCDAFYRGDFWETIRSMTGINSLSESEYLHLHKSELVQSGCKQGGSDSTDPIDFVKVKFQDLIEPGDTLVEQ